jgi:nicotinamidase-related amidase
MMLTPQTLGEMMDRRGYEYAFQALPARSTALVLIDLTDLFFGHTDEDLALAERLNGLADHLRSSGGVVMWVRPAPFIHNSMMQELLGPKLAGMHSAAQHQNDPRNQLASCLDVGSDDLHVRKTLFSAFFPGSSPADVRLKERNIQYVLIGGVVTDVCVEASARDSFSCGFRTILLSDGSRGSNDEAQAITLNRFHRLFGDVRSVAEAQKLLAQSSSSS